MSNISSNNPTMNNTPLKVEVYQKRKTTYHDRIDTARINDKGEKEGKYKTKYNTGLVKRFEGIIIGGKANNGKIIETNNLGEIEYTIVDGKKEGKMTCKGKFESLYKANVEVKRIFPDGGYTEFGEVNNITRFYSNGDTLNFKKDANKGTLTLKNGYPMQCEIKDTLANRTLVNEHGNQFIYINGIRQSEPPVPYISETESEEAKCEEMDVIPKK